MDIHPQSVHVQFGKLGEASSAVAGSSLGRIQTWALVAANTFEFFDFFMYTTLAAYIGRAFFPPGASINSALLPFVIFAVGYLSRPVGGVVIGRYADTRGRKPAMLLTGTLITLGAIGIAVTPTYETIGVSAAFLILAFRMLQGLAIGGEMGSSSALLIERSPAGKTGLYGGYQMAGQGIAMMAAGICGLALSIALPASLLLDWGWRLPFALGAVLVPIQLFLRKSIREPAAIVKRTAASKIGARDCGMPLVLSSLLILGGTVPTYIVIYVTSFGLSGRAPSATASFVTTGVTGAITVAASMAGGALADFVGLNAVIIVSRAATALVVYPAFAVAVSHHSEIVSMLMIALIAGLSALGGGPTIALILQKFRPDHRATGLSLAYATGVGLFGGTAPLVASTLTRWSGNALASAWYVMAAATCAVIAQLLLTKWRSYPLQPSQEPERVSTG
ncbi:MFS transporter [Paraburkholderia sp. BL25I1N1]|uniref:MFS transporter n=1 Tax=Paraburkholderia sp. BL25I1N1 TaxID=1938804 RepID=UPI000D07C1E5|nr:MFS transporter [Paraburkholderia sp. BL25I1N1]PRY06163.1 putative MFS family arabinose efflux permease [Paraburkholderia sp. BL25I1N1]